VLNESSLLGSCCCVILTGAVVCVCVCVCVRTSYPQLLVAKALLLLNYIIKLGTDGQKWVSDLLLSLYLKTGTQEYDPKKSHAR